jgi:hypothetical protein
MAKVMYERLERYDYLTGALKGAHVKLYDTVTLQEGDAMSYATAATQGFTQTDILTAVQSGAIIAMDAANAALATEQAAHAATSALLATAQAKLTKAGIA